MYAPVDCRAGLIAVCLASSLAAFDLPLPADESEALRMLGEGALDSATWVQIEPFYNNPVCVPCGELDALALFVPERSADLPVSADALDRYEPWDTESIERFFNDYPWLREFRPIMTFSRAGATWGAVSARYYRSGLDNYTGKQAGFDLSPISPLSFAGRFGITSEAAMVQQRSMRAGFSPLGTLSLGNCGPPSDDGLLLGRFHAYETDSTNALDQWRYGTLRSWNGAVWRLAGEGRSAASVTAFGHDRPTERAAGFRSEFHPWHSVAVRAGASYLATTDSVSDRRPFFAAHLGIDAALERWKINASTCLTMHDGVYAPVIVSIEHRRDRALVDAVVTWLPSGLAAPRSSVAGALFDRIGLDADTVVVPAPLVCVDWSIERRIGDIAALRKKKWRILLLSNHLTLQSAALAPCLAL
jgi:hypothetical protein